VTDAVSRRGIRVGFGISTAHASTAGSVSQVREREGRGGRTDSFRNLMILRGCRMLL
jgi:hypothetical protein